MNEGSRLQRQSDNEDVVLVRVPPPARIIQLEENLRDIEEGSGDFSLLLWPLALLFFGLGDTFSSFLVFSRGGTELNPVMNWALSLPGGLLAFVLVKAVAMSLLYFVAYKWEGIHQWAIPLMMTVAGVYLTASNTMVYLGIR